MSASADHPLSLATPLLADHIPNDEAALLNLSSSDEASLDRDPHGRGGIDIGLDLHHSPSSSSCVDEPLPRFVNFHLVPDVILSKHIFPFLPRNDLLRGVAGVSRRFQRLATIDDVWMPFRPGLFRTRHSSRIHQNIFRSYCSGSREAAKRLLDAPGRRRLLRRVECLAHVAYLLLTSILTLITIIILCYYSGASSYAAIPLLVAWVVVWCPAFFIFETSSLLSLCYGTRDWSSTREDVVLRYRLGPAAREDVLGAARQLGSGRQRVSEWGLAGGMGTCAVGTGLGLGCAVLCGGMVMAKAMKSNGVIVGAFVILWVVGALVMGCGVGVAVWCGVARRVRAWEFGGRCFLGCVIAPCVASGWFLLCAGIQAVVLSISTILPTTGSGGLGVSVLVPTYVFCGGIGIIFVFSLCCWLWCAFGCFTCEKRRCQNESIPYPRYARNRGPDARLRQPRLATFCCGDAKHYRVGPLIFLVLFPLLVFVALLVSGVIAFVVLITVNIVDNNLSTLFTVKNLVPFVPLLAVLFLVVFSWIVLYVIELSLRLRSSESTGLWDWIAERCLLRDDEIKRRRSQKRKADRMSRRASRKSGGAGNEKRTHVGQSSAYQYRRLGNWSI